MLGHLPTAATVIGSDIAKSILKAKRNTTSNSRHTRTEESFDDWVPSVARDQHDAVDVATLDITQHLRPLCRCTRNHQDKWEISTRQRGGSCAVEGREVRVLKQQLLRFGQEETDRPSTPCGKGPSRVGHHVSRLSNSGLDLAAGFLRHEGSAVQNP